MTYTIENDKLAYSLNERGMVVSVFNKAVGHEYCKAPGELFRGIFAQGEYAERTVDAADQDAPEITADGTVMTVFYPRLKGKENTVEVSLRYVFSLVGNELHTNCTVENRDDCMFAELQTTPMAGIFALNGDETRDSLLVPFRLGQRIPNPCHADYFRYSEGIRKKYERRDNVHSDFDLMYPGQCGMQWYTLYNDEESIYISNHDTKHRTISMHIERRMTDNTLRLGIIQFPFLEKGESYEIPTLVSGLAAGDWHEGSRSYRKWMVEEYGWKMCQRPQWAREFEGFLRCIFRTQSGEYNFRFRDIPWMFDEAQAAGINTIFLLGWERYGFGRMRPEYYAADDQLEDLKKGIEYVHSKGGKLLMYISYHAIDRHSPYYLNENGEACCMRDLWGNHILFAETYAYDGTYRKIFNNPHSQYCTCSGSDQWHEKMKKSADYCLELGADGVLYDLGGTKPLFCFAEGHDHKKPNESRASKAARYADLRKNIKRYGSERIMMQEHCIDIYAQHQDIVQPPVFAMDDRFKPEMYFYTFPEVRATNRNNALDEENMYTQINYSFLYNLAFDLSIFRCCGTPKDIPAYTAYMKKIIALREQHRDFFFDGRFIDEDGFTADGGGFRNKAYRAADGRLGIAVWNPAGEGTVTYTNTETGKTVSVTLKTDEAAFVEL